MHLCQARQRGSGGHVAMLGFDSPAAVTYRLISGAGATASNSSKNASADS